MLSWELIFNGRFSITRNNIFEDTVNPIRKTFRIVYNFRIGRNTIFYSSMESIKLKNGIMLIFTLRIIFSLLEIVSTLSIYFKSLAFLIIFFESALFIKNLLKIIGKIVIFFDLI